ncbi:MAG: lysophospholipid acyltransferase family protein [Gammaproteobacteria bacterium]|nr:lysophospholipid acyltransferase family protein [Gammaproteobacteria bacterium]
MPRAELGVRLGIVLVRSLAWALACFGLGPLRCLGAVAGFLISLGNSREARVTRANVDLVYGDKNRAWRRRLVRASLKHTSMTLAEATALWTWPLSRLAKLRTGVEGEELLTRRAPGRGAIVLVPHYGNWEYLGYYLNTLETLTPLYQRRRSQAVDQVLAAARDRLGSRSAPDSVAGLRQLLKTLRAGGLLAILPDQVPSADSAVAAPFFGRPALTMSLVSKLLQRTDVDIVVGTATRVPGGFAIRLEAIDDAVRHPDPAIGARTINAAIEAVVARDPAQYQWEYKRFRLPDQPRIYDGQTAFR